MERMAGERPTPMPNPPDYKEVREQHPAPPDHCLLNAANEELLLPQVNLTWSQWRQCIKKTCRDYYFTWAEDPEEARRLKAQREEEDHAQKVALDSIAADAARTGEVGIPALQSLLKSRLALYSHAVKEFIRGFRDAADGKPDPEGEEERERDEKEGKRKQGEGAGGKVDSKAGVAKS